MLWLNPSIFYSHSTRFSRYFKPKTAVRMEHFYRKMRQRFEVLMNADKEPEGGKWNYDAANRNKLKPADLAAIPAPLCFTNDVRHNPC